MHVYDLAAKEAKESQVIRGHTNEVWAVAFHPNNRNLSRQAGMLPSACGTSGPATK